MGFVSGAHKRGCIWALLALNNLCVRLLIKGIVSGERSLVEKEDQESSSIFVFFVLFIEELDFGGFFFFFFLSFVCGIKNRFEKQFGAVKNPFPSFEVDGSVDLTIVLAHVLLCLF